MRVCHPAKVGKSPGAPPYTTSARLSFLPVAAGVVQTSLPLISYRSWSGLRHFPQASEVRKSPARVRPRTNTHVLGNRG